MLEYAGLGPTWLQWLPLVGPIISRLPLPPMVSDDDSDRHSPLFFVRRKVFFCSTMSSSSSSPLTLSESELARLAAGLAKYPPPPNTTYKYGTAGFRMEYVHVLHKQQRTFPIHPPPFTCSTKLADSLTHKPKQTCACVFVCVCVCGFVGLHCCRL